LLNQLGIEPSEPMLFGLGEGLDYIFWKMKIMPFPFIGGRVKPDALTENIAKNLHLKLTVCETTSKDKAWNSVKNLIDSGKAVGLKLDCFHLEYFSNPIHFAGHYVAIYGYDDQFAYLVDTLQQGTKVKTSLSSLALARAEKGPMSSKNLYYFIEPGNEKFNLPDAVMAAVRANAQRYLNPPISNVGYRGIAKTSKEVIALYKSCKDIKGEFGMSAKLMERGGTGGALFRNLYRDFLKEGYQLTGSEVLHQGYEDFCVIASDWAQVIELFQKIADTQKEQYVADVSELFLELSKLEYAAMQKLSQI
jgi:hypothetical protein